jgi:hypothetical protein
MSETETAAVPESFDSAESAVRFLIQRDEKNPPAESADTATAEPELSSQEDNTAPEKGPGETANLEPEPVPPVERPRSWSKDDDDDWNALPRERQERIAANERAREADISQRINKAADTAKAAEAKVAQAEETRLKYEAKLPEVMQRLIDHNNKEFDLIKSPADLQKLATEAMRLATTDPVAAGEIQGYLTAWRVHQDTMLATKAELDQSNQRKTEQERSDWATFLNENNAKAGEKIPELADKAKSEALVNTAGDMFMKIGFSQADLDGFKVGTKISPYDFRMQQIIVDAIKYRQMEQAKATIPAKLAKNLPPVVRPGTSRPQGDASERIQALDSKLNNSGSLEDATALLMAKRNAGQRRAS